MTDINDLSQNMYDFFQKRFGADTGNLGPGSMFLAFENVGTIISEDDFKYQGSFNPAIALQRGSTLVDFIVQLQPDGDIKSRGDISPKLNTGYQNLLSGAHYLSQSSDDPAVGDFLQLKGQAQRRFDESKADMDPEFWPAVFTPGNWFNGQDPSIWSPYSYSAGASTGAGSPEPTPSIPSKVILNSWQWRTMTPEAAPQWETVSSLHTLPAEEVINAKVSMEVAAPAVSPEVLMMAFQPNIKQDVVNPINNAVASHVAVAKNMFAVTSQSAVEQPVNAITSKPAAEVIVAVPVAHATNPIGIRYAAIRQVITDLPQQKVTSTNFNLSFEYCVVQVDRPWLSAEFLNAPNWYMPDLESSYYASGTYANDDRGFAFLPSKFVVVKNLRISAQWSDEDRHQIQNSPTLGPITLVSRDFQGEELSLPGMQIIAWFCQVMPIMPPKSDPQLSAAPTVP